MLAGIGCKAKEVWNKMWSAGYVTCPVSCNTSQPFTSCDCSCPAIDHETLSLEETQAILDQLSLKEYIRMQYRYETVEGAWGINGLTTRQQKEFMQWCVRPRLDRSPRRVARRCARAFGVLGVALFCFVSAPPGPARATAPAASHRMLSDPRTSLVGEWQRTAAAPPLPHAHDA